MGRRLRSGGGKWESARGFAGGTGGGCCGRQPGSEVSGPLAEPRQLGCGVRAGWGGVFEVRALHSVVSDSSSREVFRTYLL